MLEEAYEANDCSASSSDEEEEVQEPEDASNRISESPNGCRAHRDQNEHTSSWVAENFDEAELVQRFVTLELAVEEEARVTCKLKCREYQWSDEDATDSPGSSDVDEETSTAHTKTSRQIYNKKVQAVHQRVVDQHRASAKKAAGVHASRNAMKNKAKKGKRAHSGNDGW